MHIYIIASPTIARHFRCISLLGSSQNAILLLRTHTQNRARHIHSLPWHCTHHDSPVGPPTAMSRSRYARISEEEWLIVEYKSYCYFWTLGHDLVKVDCQTLLQSRVLQASDHTPRQLCYTAAQWYSCCSSALEENNTNKYKKQLNKLKKQVGIVGPKSTQTDKMQPYTHFHRNSVA